MMIATNILIAQRHAIYGMINAFDNISLIGAEIKVKSTKKPYEQIQPEVL